MSVLRDSGGMAGIGHTVFEGARVEVFGVIENVIRHGRNLIVARLEAPLANTGCSSRGSERQPGYDLQAPLRGLVLVGSSLAHRGHYADCRNDHVTATSAAQGPSAQRPREPIPVTPRISHWHSPPRAQLEPAVRELFRAMRSWSASAASPAFRHAGWHAAPADCHPRS